MLPVQPERKLLWQLGEIMMRSDLSLLQKMEHLPAHQGGRMYSKGNPWFVILACLFFFITSCGGGNSTFDPVNGTLSIEGVTNTNSSGSVAVKLISPHGSGPGTGTITISASNPDLVTFTPTSQTADSSGNAVFSFTTKETQADTSVNFTVAVGALSLTRPITVFAAGTLSLAVTVPSSTNAAGTVTATYAGGSKATGRTISIAADNTNIAFDTTSQSADANGQAVFSYRTVNLATDTTVTFTATTSAQTVSQSILVPATSTSTPPVVTNAKVNSIAYTSASPTSISIKGAGGSGRSETSVITFVVKDETGQAMASQTVDFTLDTSVGGLTIVPSSAVSDSAGTVKTIVNAGVVATPVRVTATVHGTTISVKSDQLIVSTGLPDQDHLSVSVANHNPEAWDFDNTQVPITVMLADHFGNPVPDGTAVYFTCYGGSINPSATTQNGIATVNWRSQDPRPFYSSTTSPPDATLSDNTLLSKNNGIAKIQVYAIGEESFTDLNGNGVADGSFTPATSTTSAVCNSTDTCEFTDLPDAFLAKSGTTDSNGNLVRNPLYDPFISFNGNTQYSYGDGKFNGILQGADSVSAPRSLYVFKNVQLVMSGSVPTVLPVSFSITPSQNSSTLKSSSITFSVKDKNGNIMPKGTIVSLSSTSGGCALVENGVVISPTSFAVNDSMTAADFKTTVSTYCTTDNTGNLIVTVTTPNGIVTPKTITLAIP
jgi:hypothetical protein